MLSVVILTKNQSDLLKVCLASVKWADEIIIVDDDSQADIISLVKQYTDKIFVHTLEDFSSQRNFGIEQAVGDWILLIDPDERVTKLLQDEIQSIIQQPQTAVAYAIPRRNFYLGVEQKQLGAWPDYVIRLIKKDAFKGYKGTLHEQPRFDGKLAYIKSPFIHLTHRNISSMTRKTIDWAPFEARLRFETNHPKMSSWRFFRICFSTFFDWYIKKGGYKSGTTGTIESIFQTFSVFMTYVNLWEMQQQPSLAEKYKQIDQKLMKSSFEEV